MTTDSNGKITVRAGYIVLNASSAFGGVHYPKKGEKKVEKNYGPLGKGSRSEINSVRVADHDELCRALDNHRKKVDYALKKWCSRTTFGWFADEAEVEKVRERVDELAEEAERLNNLARAEGCARRIHIGIVLSEINLATEDAARELAVSIQTFLGNIRELLRAGKIESGAYDKHWTKCKNLENLGVGFGEEVIKLALEEAKVARRAIRERIRQGQTPASAGRKEELGCLKNAIEFFGGEVESEDDSEAEELAQAAASGAAVSAF